MLGGQVPCSYDVFLSFRGEDTRLGFTGNLYCALNQRGIRTFIDDEELQRGEELTPALVNAIKQSRVAITVLSKNYAFSSFCLDELATILDCINGKKDRLVLPVFYGVDPSDVRHHRGSYGEALARHDERFKHEIGKVNKWRVALNQVSNLAGFTFNHGDGYEYQFIGRIIKEVCSKINRTLLHVASYPVGLESRVRKVNKLLNVGYDDVVHMVGIHGIGGIGKTTIARAVYNLTNDQFEGLCFLEDVRVNSVKYGLVHLQELVLSEILGDKDIKLGNVNNGMSILQQRLHKKKVLLVLDDVDKKEQLQAIVGAPDWFGCGSRVIITTREKRLLTSHRVELESIYEVEELNDTEAHELLRWNAFKSDKVDPSFRGILNRAVAYASRLPLALEAIGSNLFGKGEKEWELALDRYKRIPDKKIQDILRVSFDSLEEEEKKIFLDIACCFGGYKLSDVEDILHAHHGSSIRYSIEQLIEKSLIKTVDGVVTLHELIQDMGREIVRLESEEPGKRSRLWFWEDVVQVLEDKLGTSKIQILILDFPKDEVNSKGPKGEKVHWDGEAFKRIKNLKTLIIRNGYFSEGPTHLPNSLRVLKWWGYPSPSLPCYFHPKKLSILELRESCLKPSEPIQIFGHLTVMDFGYSESVTEIPDVSALRNLQKLSFKHCENLIKIHDSVGYLGNLKILDAASCKKLKTFPPIILTSLEQLNLSHCSILESFPEILGKMESITELHIMGSPIKEFPFSIRNLTRLRKLELQKCEKVQLPSSIVMLPELGLMHVSECQGLCLSYQRKDEEIVSKSSNIERLILSYCNISDDFLPRVLSWFANVKDLNLSGNKFEVLDACIKECHSLRNLKLDHCRDLREIVGIPWKLEMFSAKGCTSLKCIDLTGFPAYAGESLFLKELILDDCVFLQEIRGVPPKLDYFSAKNCTSLTSWCTSMILNQETVEGGNTMFCLPGTKIPEWFAHRMRGESIKFWFRNKFPAISLCLIIGLMNEQPTIVKFSPRVFINGNKQSLASREVYEFRIETDHIFMFDIQLQKSEDNMGMGFSEKEWNHVEVSYSDHITNNEVPIKLVAKHSGIHLLKKLSSMADIQFTDPNYRKRKSDVLSWESENYLLVNENHRLVSMGISKIEYMPNQHVEHRHGMQSIKNGNWDSHSMDGLCQRVKITTMRPWKDQNMLPSSSIFTSTQPPPAEAGKSLTSQPRPLVEKPCEDIGGETSKKIPGYEVHPTTQNDPCVTKTCQRSADVELRGVSSVELESDEISSLSKGSDSDDPFDWVSKKLSNSYKETISSRATSGDASLTFIREAIETLELLMVKDLSEVSSDLATRSKLDHSLDVLSRSSHHKVTVEVKEALVDFKRKAFSSFKEFQATVECVNKLNYFKNQMARIEKETSAGRDQRNDLKISMKKASMAIKAKINRKKELEAEIATLKKQLTTKESDLEQLVLNVKDQKTTLSAYSKKRHSLEEQAVALSNEIDDLKSANSGVEVEGEAAEVKQNGLKSTWSTDLTSQLKKIKNNILGAE